MAERKSKPRKKDEDEEEATGWARIRQSPWFLFTIVVVIIIAVVALLFGISEFLAAQ